MHVFILLLNIIILRLFICFLLYHIASSITQKTLRVPITEYMYNSAEFTGIWYIILCNIYNENCACAATIAWVPC